MPTLADLPVEVLADILGRIDNPQIFSSVALSCKHVFSSTRLFRADIQVFINAVHPDLVPLAVAAVQVQDGLHRWPPTESTKALFDAMYDTPDVLVAQFKELDTLKVRFMWKTHYLIESLGMEYATKAWENVNAMLDREPTPLLLSDSEKFRIYRAFYRAEIFHLAFRDEIVNPSQFLTYYMTRQTAWENEQMVCVEEFLDYLFGKSSIEFFAHDVRAGQARVDYLRGGPDNEIRQAWISEGIHFLNLVRKQTSYEELRPYLSAIRPNEGRGLLKIFSYARLNNPRRNIPSLTEQQVFDAIDHQDKDKGPFRCWQEVILKLRGWRLPQRDRLWYGMLFANSRNLWLRDCAYVFWDDARVRQNELLEMIVADDRGNPPVLNSLSVDNLQLQEMDDSSFERAEIWDKGGSGYWKRGDYSKIRWRTKRPPSIERNSLSAPNRWWCL